MMKKLIVTLSIPWLLQAQDISELFTALKSHTQAKSDTMLIKRSKMQKEMANSALYPEVNLFASYDHYSEDTGLLPVPPNKLMPMIQNQKLAQPFSDNIFRAGVNFSMPVFVKSIYTTAKKAEAMQNSAKAKKEINIIKNEAIIVSSNANFIYLESLKKALQTKEKSLQETKKTVNMKVKNGRSPASALYKINDSLNEIAISKNNIELQKSKLISNIESLTGIRLNSSINMKQIRNYTEGDIGSLKPLKEKIKADKIDIKIQKEKLYPALFAQGSYVYSKAKAYNNNKDLNENYSDIGLILKMPLLSMKKYKEITLAKLKFQSSKIDLQKLKDELKSQANMLKESLQLEDNSIKLYEHSIEDKKKLLKIAKVNYNSGRLSTEEYLRYEDAVVAQEANLYKTKATKWQTLMSLAVIYANNIEEMVK